MRWIGDMDVGMYCILMQLNAVAIYIYSFRRLRRFTRHWGAAMSLMIIIFCILSAVKIHRKSLRLWPHS